VVRSGGWRRCLRATFTADRADRLGDFLEAGARGQQQRENFEREFLMFGSERLWIAAISDWIFGVSIGSALVPHESTS
jgi:hypothetical protein